MNSIIADAVNTTFGTIALGTALWEIRRPNFSARICGIYAIVFGASSIGLFIEYLTAALAYGSAGAIYAWLWWHRRPPRQRRPSKTLAAIRDLGHRLVVTS